MVFLVKSLQNWGYDRITCLTEMLVTQLWSSKHIKYIIWVTWQNFAVDVRDRNYDVITLISKYLILRRPRVANFADIIKIKTTFKDWKKIKRIRNYILKCICTCISWCNKSCWKKMIFLQNSRGVPRDLYIV